MLNFLELSDGCLMVLGVVYFLRELLKIVFIAVPIILIVMISIDFVKALINDEDGAKTVSIVTRRVSYGVIIFLIPSVVFAFFDIVDISVHDSSSCWNYVEERSLEEIKTLMQQQQDAMEAKNKSLSGSANVKEVEMSSGMEVNSDKKSASIDISNKKLKKRATIPMYIYDGSQKKIKGTNRAVQGFAIKSASGADMQVVYLVNAINHPTKSTFESSKLNTIVTYNTVTGDKSYMLYANGAHGQTLEIDSNNLWVECNATYRGSSLRVGNKNICSIPYYDANGSKVKKGSEGSVISFSTTKKGYSLYNANGNINYPDMAIDPVLDYAAVIDGTRLYTFKWSELKSKGKNAQYIAYKKIDVNTMQAIAMYNGYVYVLDNHEPNPSSHAIKIYCYDKNGKLISKTSSLWAVDSKKERQEAEGISIYNGKIYVAVDVSGKKFKVYELT